MRSRAGRLALGMAIGALLASAPAALRAQDSGIPVGSAAPAAKLLTLDGKTADLAQVVGKGPALIEFWATWCPNCKELEPTLKAMHAKYGKQVRFVGVSVSANQSMERVKLYVAKHQMPGTQLFDRDGDATVAYDVPATSYVVVIDKRGKVVYTGLGGKQDLEGAIRKSLQ